METDFDTLIAQLRTGDEAARIHAALHLGTLRDPRAFDHLVAVLHDKNRYLRENAAVALWRIDHERAFPLLLPILDDTDEDVVKRIWMEWRIRPDEQIAALALKHYQHHNHMIRFHIAAILAQKMPPEATEPLITLLADLDDWVREAAAYLSRQEIDERLIGPLIRALKDSYEPVRTHAAWTLGNAGDLRAVEPLIENLRDPAWQVRSAAASALGYVKDLRAVPYLINALQDEDADVRAHAAQSLGWIISAVTLTTVEALTPLLDDDAASPYTKVSDDVLRALQDIDTFEAHQAIELWRQNKEQLQE